MKKAFSLIEVLVFTTVLSFFFIAAMSTATYTLRTMKTNQHKILATHYAQAAMEWLRSQKESSWAVYTALDTGAGATGYCLNDLNFNSVGDCGTNYSLGTPAIFKRELILENDPDSTTPDRVNTTVKVEWIEAGRVTDVVLESIFTTIE